MRIKNEQSYPIVIGANLDKKLIQVVRREIGQGRIAIITDSRLALNQGKKMFKKFKATGLLVELFVFPAGEKNKTQNQVTKLQHALLKKHYGRDTLIIALGGGVVGDLAGFVAATYLRGVSFIQVPTTVLAMVDASIGGKVGVDTVYGKNTIGAFYQPRAVIMDIARLGLLPPLQITNGLMEAIKTFFTSDSSMLKLVLKINVNNITANSRALAEIIERSVAIKAGIVMRDEHELNERRVINFGHTIGHALEKLSGYSIPHGLVVGYGMLAEAKVAESLGILSSRDCSYLFDYLAHFGISSAIFKKFSARDILSATRTDKKTKHGRPYYVLLKKIGGVYAKGRQFAHPVDDLIVKKVLFNLGAKK